MLTRVSLLRFALVIALATPLGCSQEPGDTPELGDVTGIVTLDGKPFPNAQVQFQPKGGRSSAGQTNEAGEYTLRYNVRLTGAKVGPHGVTITPDDAEDETPSRFPKIYMQAGELTATVEAGDNQIDFPLTSK